MKRCTDFADQQTILRLRKEGQTYRSVFTLWLAGREVEHELIRRVIENGCVERSHRTRSAASRLCWSTRKPHNPDAGIVQPMN